MTELQPYEQQFLLSQNQWELTWKQCGVLVKSGFLPSSINTIEKCVSIVLMGRELGLAPMTALMNNSVIKGKPTLEAKLMISLVLKRYPQAYYKIVSNTAQAAEVHLGRDRESCGKFCYTITQAKDAGLLAKDNWKHYPADMLLWRAISRACRVMFPDVLTVTSHTTDEIETITVKPEKKPLEEKTEPQEDTQLESSVNESKNAKPKTQSEIILENLIDENKDE